MLTCAIQCVAGVAVSRKQAHTIGMFSAGVAALRYYETWLAWINMERGLRQIPAARSLFKRCYSRHFEEGGQLALAYEWIKFEREEGRSAEANAARQYQG